MNEQARTLHIGWAETDITPREPVLIAGQFHARVSEGVMDPVTATALALDGPAGKQAVMVSCDLVSIPDTFRDAVREQIKVRLPELDPDKVFLNATHTHAAPELREDGFSVTGGGNVPTRIGVELEVTDPPEYVAFAAGRIADAIDQAWQARAPGGIAFGLGYAVVGRNRRLSYTNGESSMYGKSDVPDFSHVEGYEDPSVNVLATYDDQDRLTGMIVNVACPSQVSEASYEISADYWHDVRVALRGRLGQDLHILPQCGAGGDQSPHILIHRRAEAHRLMLLGRIEAVPAEMGNNPGGAEALRQELAARITEAILPLLPGMQKTIDPTPRFEHHSVTIDIARRALTQADVDEALAQAAEFEQKYEALKADFAAHPEKQREPRWYVGITTAYRRMRWFRGVETRYQLQQKHPRLPVELHVVRLGDTAIATNPFEFYLDYGMQIKARSPAVLTFVVQLAGSGTYLPTERAVAGKSYGAIPASTPIGPEGGHDVVENTLAILRELWQ